MQTISEFELIPTNNHSGFMWACIDPCTQHLFELTEVNKLICDVGCAFGFTSIFFAEKDCQVDAVDKETSHLEAISHKNINPILDSLPLLEKLNAEHYDAVICSRVLHFIHPDLYNTALINLKRVLKQGGLLCIVSESPYFPIWERLANEYDVNVNNHYDYPGMMEPFSDYVTDVVDKSVAPDFLNVLGLNELTKKLETIGFSVIYAKHFSIADMPKNLRYDGRESFGIIARLD